MSKFEFKEKVFYLRKRVVSINDIAEDVGLSKSTVSQWCRDIKLTYSQSKRLKEKVIKAGHKGRILGALANRRKKEASIEMCKKWAAQAFDTMSERDFFIAGISLYWAEGSKSDKHQLSFVNSDPTMVAFMYKWFCMFFDIIPEDFIVRIFINEIHRSRIKKVLNFWSGLLQLTQDNFRKTIFIKTRQRKVYLNHDSYYGLLSLRMRRSSLLKYKTLALIDLMRNAGVAQVVRASHS